MGTLDRVIIFALLHSGGTSYPPGMLHEGAHAWNPRRLTRGTTAHAFARTQSSLGLDVPPRVSFQAGHNLSSVRSKVSGDPVQGGWCGGDGWDQLARWIFLRVFLTQAQTKLEPRRTNSQFCQKICWGHLCMDARFFWTPKRGRSVREIYLVPSHSSVFATSHTLVCFLRVGIRWPKTIGN